MLDHVLSILIRNSIDAAILAGLVGVTLFVLREGIAAKWRFLLWGLVIIRLAMPVQPPGSFGLSVVSDAVLPRTPVVQADHGQLTESTSPRIGPTISSIPIDGGTPEPSISESEEPIGTAVDEVASSAGVEAVVASPRRESAVSGDDPVSRSSTPFFWTRTILAVWLLGVAVLLARRLMAGAKLRMLLSRSTGCASPQLMDEFANCRRQLRIDQQIRLEMLDDVTGPAVTGILRARVLCPAYVETELTSSDRRLLLLHELMHVARRDVLWKELVDLVCLLNWFHPLAWWVRRRMEQERELACDAGVLELSIPEERAQYGRMALRLLELQQVHPIAPGLVAWSGPKKHLKRRIEMIARFESPRRRQTLVAVMLTAAMAVIGLTRAADNVNDVATTATDDVEVTGDEVTDAAAADTILVAGRCIDEDQNPLLGVSLRLVRVDFSDDTVQVLANAMTDADGSFQFPAVPAFDHESGVGHDVVVAQLEEKSTAIQFLQPGRGAAESWAELNLVLGQAASISGRVVDHAGRPVVGADVYRPVIPGEPLPDVWHSRTNANGEYDIDDSTVIWQVEENVPGSGTTWLSQAVFVFYVSHPEFGTRSVRGTASPAVIDVVLDPPAIVEGQVIHADGSPAAGVKVSTQSVEHRHWGEVRTDAEGRYRLVLAEVDDYNIWASADDLICAAVDSFQVAAGETREAPTLTLVEGGFVTGRVLDADTGKPLESYPEQTSVASYGPHRPQSGAACISAPVDADGRYELRVAPGDAYVYLMNGHEWSLVDPQYTTVAVAAGESVTVDFLVREQGAAETTTSTNAIDSPEPQPEDSEFLRQRGLARAERAAIAAITELGGWVETEIIDGNEFVTTLNMVYHEPEDGPRLENNNKLTDEALFYATKFTHLRMLLLHQTQASDEGLAHVAGLSELEKVYIWDGIIVTDVGVAHLAALPNLTYIHLDNSAVTDQSLELLSHLPGLKGISMQGGAFTDQGLEHLAGMTQLESLWIGQGETHITDNGLMHLTGLDNLRELDLQGTEITDVGLLHLHGLKNLTNLYVSGTGVTDEGVAAIREAIPGLDVRP